MIRNQIHKVLSTFQSYEVRALLMGGQACVFYGAAEFSRDTDFAIAIDSDNWARLHRALDALQAKVIAVPPMSREYLDRGHAIHFRCHHPEASGLRVDIMSKMRGVDVFEDLWDRRTTIQGENGAVYEVMSLPDLVCAKKTQRDKDWPMIRRLIEADRIACQGIPSIEQARFWLSEARTPDLLIELAKVFPDEATDLAIQSRPLLRAALQGDPFGIESALIVEEQQERTADRAYWGPLKKELEQLRHS